MIRTERLEPVFTRSQLSVERPGVTDRTLTRLALVYGPSACRQTLVIAPMPAVHLGSRLRREFKFFEWLDSGTYNFFKVQ